MKTSICTGFLFLCLAANAQNQKMYCLASAGGAYYGGTILSMTTDSIKVEFSFQPPGGYTPMGNLVQASNGKLYGVCYDGGTYFSCTIFCWDTLTKTYTDVYNFGDTTGGIFDGDWPTSAPIEVEGVLYGTAVEVIYSFDIYTGVYTVVHDLMAGNSHDPYGSPVRHSNGKLYGTTVTGGSLSVGAIYSFDLTNNTYSEAHNFDGYHGAQSYGSMIELSDGKLYGMTSAGGVTGHGVIFSFDPSTNIYTDLHDFNNADGAGPRGSLMKSANGLLYGMTTEGGIDSAGVIFSFNPSNNVYVKLYDFDKIHGGYPLGTLNESNGILYGTTSRGGNSYYDGVIFNYNLANNTYTDMLHLDGQTYGGNPNGGFITVTNIPTGIIAPAADDLQLNVYPNPVKQFAECFLQLAKDAKVQLTMTDESGKEIYSEQFTTNNSRLKTMVDMRNFSSGTYFLKAIIDGKATMAKKLVKSL